MAIKGLGRIVRSVRALGRGLSGSSVPVLPLKVPAIGLALGGGFARGIAHIGVLKVFEDEQIPIACIAGTSVGALIGAAYCGGMSAAELEALAERVRMRDLARWTISRLGFATNLRMITFLNKVLQVKTFEELRIPLAIAATDIVTGEPAVFTSGDLIDPVRASCAYPGMFQPVKIGDRLLVDGLLGHSVPSMPLRDMGADRVISVYLAAHWVKPGGPRHVFDVIGQCFSIAQARMCGPWQSASDLILQPEIGGFAYDDFVRAPELIRAGEAAARAIVPKLHEWMPAQPEVQIATHMETPAALPTLTTEPIQ